MDINQNQLTNTFLKGMNTDTSDMLLGTDQYRYAENVRIVTNTDNDSGELRLVEGNTFLYNLGLTILASNYIRDIAVFITLNNDKWSVIRLDKNENEWVATVVFGPCSEKIWKNDNKSITTVMRYESPENIKLYIADSTRTHSIMVLNVAPGKELGDVTFEEAFGYQRTLLPPAEVEVSNGSGSIVSGIVQYAYRLYSKNKPATLISILSNTLTLYRNSYSGYEAEKPSGRAVSISIEDPQNGLDYIQVYRISYQVSGQLPKISLIKDQKITSSLIDTGVDIEEISLSEFLSMFTSQIYPSQIESKGDYLFAANMKYSQDTVDDTFEYFDARSYSLGNYINEARGSSVVEIADKDTDVPHYAFPEEGNTPEYNPEHWRDMDVNGEVCNGYGKYICWKYIYDDIAPVGGTATDLDTENIFTAENQTGTYKSTKSTFRCGETYRFGVRLFDKYGNASSVKWIADIMIPTGANMRKTGNEIYTRYSFCNVGILFFKTPGSDWQNVAGWEIVRCERLLKDRKAITQGIIGFPVLEYEYTQSFVQPILSGETKLICTPGVFTTNPFLITSDIFSGLSIPYKAATTTADVIMMGSPEYCYQPDDIKDILQRYKTDLYLTKVYKTIPNGYRDIAGGYTYVRSVLSANSDLSYTFFCGNTQFEGSVSTGGFICNGGTYEDSFGKTTRDGTAITRWYINYFTPTYNLFTKYDSSDKTNIKSLAFVDSPKSDDFANEELLIYKDSVRTIDTFLFTNWSTPLILDLHGNDETFVKSWMNNYSDHSSIGFLENEIRTRIEYPIGTGGKTILIKPSDSNITIDPIDINNPHLPSINVYNINKNCIPYGGYSRSSIENSSYISLGDYTKGDSIDVYSGDTKNRIFTYNALHNWYDSTYKNCSKMATVYAIPVETDIDIQGQYGQLYNVDGFTDYRIQDSPGAFEGFSQEKDAYMYNTAYNATPDIVSWTTPEMLENKQDYFDTRVHYSNVKTNNEDVDSWTQFQAANYIDVDSRYGEITDLKLFKDRLIFWQENATGVLAVNERVVLNDQNDTQVVLGTGGVLERYDYFSTIYGLKKNQHARTESNTSLFWWDGNNKEILVHQDKYNVTPLSTIKNVKNYVNEHDESTTPFMTYDNKYKEVLMNVVNNLTLAYNEQIDAFTSVYTFTPIYDAVINGELLLTSDNIVYKHNTSNGDAILFNSKAKPLIKYVVNSQPTYNKTFDIQTIGGRFYGGGEDDNRSIPYTGYEKDQIGDKHARDNTVLKELTFTYDTPLKQHASIRGDKLTNVEYDFRLTIPRNGETAEFDRQLDYGNRLRGKTMRCEIKSNSNALDFALQYITTKFRMSWT